MPHARFDCMDIFFLVVSFLVVVVAVAAIAWGLIRDSR
jgi:hypothetical protein